jgi:uncharacterized protein (TIGR04255 family)
LKIQGQLPIEFQERVRSVFPLMERPQAIPNGLPFQMPPEIQQMLGQAAGGAPYNFLTEDRSYTLSLAPEAISLTTQKYSTWDVFFSLLRPPLQALESIYQPSFFNRIGLRYINIVYKETIGLADVPWSHLIQSPLLGELSLPSFEHNLQNVSRSIQVKLPDGTGSVMLQHGFAEMAGRRGSGYMIDFDFFVDGKTNVSDADQTIINFNRRAGHAFRWAITDKLHDALQPESSPAVAKRA